MSSEGAPWRRRLEAAGLTWEAHGSWPVLPLDGDAGVYQPVGDTSGIFFIRHGPGAALDDYLGGLGDAMTDVTIARDEPFRLDDQMGRRVEVVLTTAEHRVYREDARRGPVDRSMPRASTLIRVVGFTRKDTPVLVGYRLPEDERSTFESLLEDMVGRVSLS